MSTLSYSSLSTADRCKRLYKYLYVDKLTPEEPKSINLTFGSAIHSGIEEIFSTGTYESFEIVMRTAPNPDALIVTGKRLLSNFQKNHKSDFEMFQMEQRLGLDLPDLRIEGTPDFLGLYQGVPSVVDFKTASQRYNDDQITCGDQLLLYAYLAQKCGVYTPKQIVYVVLIKTKDPYIQVLTKPIDSLKFEERIANILEKSQQLVKTDKFSQNFNSCLAFGQRCPFWSRCHE